MSLSIIIVNYRSSNYIINCLKSAFEFDSAKNFEWIVVDNASGDHSRQQITNLFPSVKWIDMGSNAGFARGNNEGIRQSSGNIVLLLNPDTLIKDDSINHCYQRLLNSNNIAAATQLLNADETPQITGNYFIKGNLNRLLTLPYLGAIAKWLALLAGIKKTNLPQAGKEEKVDWINGAYLMVKKQAIQKAGLLDEDFFLYYEEVEWCSRLMKHGSLVVYGDLHTIHLQGESISAATNSYDKGYYNLFDKKGLQLLVSGMVQIRKQWGVGWFIFHLLVLIFEIPFFLLCSTINSLISLKSPFYEWKKWLGFTKNVFVLLKLTPAIYSGKPHFYKMF
ncbi:MAG TPA: glycosyltransferase family 2 protein [Ferruginibacter sp.]|nr:glycosyltransferase family 2 protein [Ferruginibacter sp.]HRE63541.1 glycosyltransferase family 2 protein [Ferruginibacter sp.]